MDTNISSPLNGESCQGISTPRTTSLETNNGEAQIDGTSMPNILNPPAVLSSPESTNPQSVQTTLDQRFVSNSPSSGNSSTQPSLEGGSPTTTTIAATTTPSLASSAPPAGMPGLHPTLPPLQMQLFYICSGVTARQPQRDSRMSLDFICNDPASAPSFGA